MKKGWNRVIAFDNICVVGLTVTRIGRGQRMDGTSGVYPSQRLALPKLRKFAIAMERPIVGIPSASAASGGQRRSR